MGIDIVLGFIPSKEESSTEETNINTFNMKTEDHTRRNYNCKRSGVVLPIISEIN